MRYSTVIVPAALLLVAVSAAAATQASPQSAAPAAVPSQTAPARTTAARQAPPSSAQAATGERGTPPEVRELEELRQTLWRDVLGQYPPSVGRSVQQKPLLLSSDDFLARYPALEAFLKEHPEVRMDQGFFFPALPGEDKGRGTGVGETLIATLVPLGFFAFLGGAAWLAHQRSVQRAAAQQEVQTKVLDRLLAREDLTSYLDTPAGRRLLESASQIGESKRGASTARMIEAVRIGVILLVVGLGLGLSVGRSNQGLRLIQSAITFTGLGFLLASGATYLLSKRLGLLQTPDSRD